MGGRQSAPARTGRQWAVYEALRSRRRGLTAAALVEATGCSRASVYRYLEVLAAAGLPITRERVNGEVRHRLVESALPAFALSSDELAALLLARTRLGPLEGTAVVEHLDRLLFRLRGAARAAAPWLSVVEPGRDHDRGTLRAIDIALRDGHRFAFDYRGASDSEPRRRVVDPLRLVVRAGHTYLVAFDVDAGARRIFKVARIQGRLDFTGPADRHPDLDDDDLFEHSVGIWAGDPVDVAVRLSAGVAPRAHEWPLVAGQRLEPRPDGAVVVRARVAGLQEVTRWVLGWGAAAEALEPAELRAAVAAELSAAARGYRDDREAPRRVSDG